MALRKEGTSYADVARRKLPQKHCSKGTEDTRKAFSSTPIHTIEEHVQNGHATASNLTEDSTERVRNARNSTTEPDALKSIAGECRGPVGPNGNSLSQDTGYVAVYQDGLMLQNAARRGVRDSTMDKLPLRSIDDIIQSTLSTNLSVAACDHNSADRLQNTSGAQEVLESNRSPRKRRRRRRGSLRVDGSGTSRTRGRRNRSTHPLHFQEGGRRSSFSVNDTSPMMHRSQHTHFPIFCTPITTTFNSTTWDPSGVPMYASSGQYSVSPFSP